MSRILTLGISISGWNSSLQLEYNELIYGMARPDQTLLSQPIVGLPSPLAEFTWNPDSVFHLRFKALTDISPLQYQKQMRLHEARRRLVTEHAEAASVGYAVGYASASQFSREYKRLFGAPPRRDAESLQSIVEAGP